MSIKKHKLDGKIDEITNWLIEGKTYRFIANELGCSLALLHDYSNKDEHSAKVRSALEYSASTYADKAEIVLKNLKKESNQIELGRARELAQHYRWAAKCRNGRKYGDATTLRGDSEAPLNPSVNVILNK